MDNATFRTISVLFRASRVTRHFMLLFLAVAAFGMPSVAHAQYETTLVEPVLPPDYNRDRNVSVSEKPREGYDPIGVRVRSFILYPYVGGGFGYTNNVYLSETQGVDDGYFHIAPSISIQSDWSRHWLALSAGGNFRNYLEETARDQSAWHVNGEGQLEIGGNLQIRTKAGFSKYYESPFSGEVEANVAALSSYEELKAGIEARYAEDRYRAALGYDYTSYDFNSVRISDGNTFAQKDRNRDIHRFQAQAEYAVSPAMAAYVQFAYVQTQYDRPLLNGDPNRDSDTWTGLAGVSFDISATMRGAVGVGYSSRKYDGPAYDDVDGISAEAKIEYFPSDLTTLTLKLRRVIQDTTVPEANAYFDNRILFGIDHDLRTNLIASLTAEYAKEDYIGTPEDTDFFQVGAGARYLISSSLGLKIDSTYSSRKRDVINPVFDGSVHEFLTVLTIFAQR